MQQRHIVNRINTVGERFDSIARAGRMFPSLGNATPGAPWRELQAKRRGLTLVQHEKVAHTV
jgi:hypothetical protein